MFLGKGLKKLLFSLSLYCWPTSAFCYCLFVCRSFSFTLSSYCIHEYLVFSFSFLFAHMDDLQFSTQIDTVMILFRFYSSHFYHKSISNKNKINANNFLFHNFTCSYDIEACVCGWDDENTCFVPVNNNCP
jgi:hypothetical protein